MNAILEPEEHVLSTLERDGSRRWLKPTLSLGKWLVRRRILAWMLIAIFTIVPFVRIGGNPLILLDVPGRMFFLFGYTFLPTDTVLLALLAVGTVLSVFIMTALFGRVWCGWACPQTVYLEFLFRPIERFFDGTTGRGGAVKKSRPAWFSLLKYPVYFVLCLHLANTFLAYFVGTDRIFEWTRQTPWQNPVPFIIVAATTIAMMLDFCFYREQICILMCPYGRFQSVLLDESSLIVSYDVARGEPRGKKRKNAEEGSLPIVGDCVDCGKCVTTCPTGIDIRKGLQMECINCTQCIDACNEVMHKVGREPNLIRYSSQKNDRKAASGFRPRLVLYPLLLTGIASLFLFVLFTKQPFDAMMSRELGSPWTRIQNEAGEVTGIRNLMQLKLTNRQVKKSEFDATVISPEGVEFVIREATRELEPSASASWHVEFIADPSVFTRGTAPAVLEITSSDGGRRELPFTLLGPR